MVVGDLVDPVWRVRRERVTAENGFLNVDAARRGVHGFLELAYEWLNSAIPDSRIRGLEIFDQLLDMAPDGISGNVGVDCPSEEEPFVEELVECVELSGIRSDF